MNHFKLLSFVALLSLLISCGTEKKTDDPVPTPHQDQNIQPQIEETETKKSGTTTLTLKENSIFLCRYWVTDEEREMTWQESGCEIWFDYYHENSLFGGYRQEEASTTSFTTPIEWDEIVLKDGKITLRNPQYRALSRVELDAINTSLNDPFLRESGKSYAPVEVNRVYILRFWNDRSKKEHFVKAQVTDYTFRESVTFQWEVLEEFQETLEPAPQFLTPSDEPLIDLGYGGTVTLTHEPHLRAYSFRNNMFGHFVRDNEVYHVEHDLEFKTGSEDKLELIRVGNRHNYTVRLDNFSDFEDLMLTDRGVVSRKNPSEDIAPLRAANSTLYGDRPRRDPDLSWLERFGTSKIFLIRVTSNREADLVLKLQVTSYQPGQSVTFQWKRLFPVKHELLTNKSLY